MQIGPDGSHLAVLVYCTRLIVDRVPTGTLKLVKTSSQQPVSTTQVDVRDRKIYLRSRELHVAHGAGTRRTYPAAKLRKLRRNEKKQNQ